MTTINKALGAFALACMAATASAAEVEVVFDVTATSRVTRVSDVAGWDHQTDPSFQPLSFSMAFRFDLTQGLDQMLFSTNGFADQAATFFSPYRVSSTQTPLTGSLLVPPPPNTPTFPGSDVRYVKSLIGDPTAANQVLPSVEEMTLITTTGWKASGIDGADSVSFQSYWRQINLSAAGGALSPNQLNKLSGDDALTFLRAQIDVLLADAFIEQANRSIDHYDAGHTKIVGSSQNGVEYKGDLTIRSVTIVPEPDTWAMMAVGLAALGLGMRRERHAHLRQP